MNIGLILLIAVALLIAYAISLYNKLVVKKTRTEEAWADIDVQLKRRYDLIPNLVETVKAYAKHEQETLDAVISARSQASSMNVNFADMKTSDLESFAALQGGLSQSLGKIFALAESYPDLKANENFLELQEELSDTEDKIQAARRFYNANVRDLNILIETFPSRIFAHMFNFTKRAFFELAENSVERENVKVSF